MKPMFHCEEFMLITMFSEVLDLYDFCFIMINS